MKWWWPLSVIIVIIRHGTWTSPMSLSWYFFTLTNPTLPNICINNDNHERSITRNRWCSYEMMMVTIRHYNYYSWRALNVTKTPIVSTIPSLVTFNFWWLRLKSVTIVHMKWWRSLFFIINHYWWRNLNITTTRILLVTPPLVMFIFWWWRLLWPSPMSLWWHFWPHVNVLFSCSFLSWNTMRRNIMPMTWI